MKRTSLRKGEGAFTLVELLVVMAIIALLLNLSFPAFTSMINKAKSMKCATNLRNIGIAASLAASDNNNTYPEINQTAPPLPYPASVPGLLGVLGPYNISTQTLQCPVDMGNGSASGYATYGSSYEWNPVFDDENVAGTVVYPTTTNPITVNSSRVRLAMDFNGQLHRGKPNAVYGDGHVSSH